ncbi:MAG: acyl-CoA dehydrogenase family protein, partial [Sphingopyxis sp.]
IGPEGAAIDLLEEARDRALALFAAEAVGLLDSLLEQTIAYTGQRRQFGQPIAGFQALQHRMVDMYLECELARSSAWLAMEALDKSAAARSRAVSSAMVNVARACRFVGQQAIQLHGGMGMTDELPIGHYVKRAMAIEVEWADADWHLARIAGL